MMPVKYILPFLVLLFFSYKVWSQAGAETDTIRELHGVILDAKEQTILPYANIYNLKTGKGTISNERGHFTLDVSGMGQTDSIRFQYIGYKTRKITIEELERSSYVYLTEEIINLSETIIFGSIPDLNTIVKNILIYKDSNYKRITSRRQAFVREREVADLNDFQLKYKRSSIDELDREMIQTIEERTPEYVTSYTDFLGDYYYNKDTDDSIRRKVDPVRMVALKEEYLDDLSELETLFEGILAQTKEDEYWKVRSGVFGTKLDLEFDTANNPVDSALESRWKTKSYAGYISYVLGYSTFDDKDQWEFLHKPGRYKFTLAGGTKVNGEEAYIIDFNPKSSGHYQGRMFVSMTTFALLRADYAYAPEKTGTDFSLLGVGYKETQFTGSIYFEKMGDDYRLKYLSYRFGYEASIDRSLLLIKKKKRWLFDKTQNEIKLRVDMVVKGEEAVEFMVLDEEPLTQDQFMEVETPKYIDVIYVDQFDENLWRGYSIIEPTQQMKAYKKQELEFNK